MPKLIGIIGSGLAGLCTAMLCEKKNWPYRIISTHIPKPNAKRLLLNAQSIQFLNKIGLEPKVLNIYPQLSINQKFGLSHLQIRAHEHNLPFIACSVAYSDLLSQLLARVSIEQSTIQDIDYQEEIIIKYNHQEKRFSHLFGCDGQHSFSRDQLNIASIHHNWAHTKVLICELEAQSLTMRFNHHLCGAILPGQPAQIILSGPTDFKDTHITPEFLKKFFNHHIELHKILHMHTFDYRPHLSNPSPRTNYTMLGDAAMSISPVAAQGFNHVLSQLNYIHSLSHLHDLTPQSLYQQNRQLFTEMGYITQHPLKRRLFMEMCAFIPQTNALLAQFGNRYGQV
jgi:2-polyprenyl-6-methoxyphenol hydroxylase-like FAD-dependent oxidoreductase